MCASSAAVIASSWLVPTTNNQTVSFTAKCSLFQDKFSATTWRWPRAEKLSYNKLHFAVKETVCYLVVWTSQDETITAAELAHITKNNNNKTIIDGCHYVWQKAQTAILHYTRGPPDWPTLKPDTGKLTFLSEIAAQNYRDTPCPGHRCFEEYHFSSAGLESANAAQERHS